MSQEAARPGGALRCVGPAPPRLSLQVPAQVPAPRCARLQLHATPDSGRRCSGSRRRSGAERLRELGQLLRSALLGGESSARAPASHSCGSGRAPRGQTDFRGPPHFGAGRGGRGASAGERRGARRDPSALETAERPAPRHYATRRASSPARGFTLRSLSPRTRHP